jgi:hypothetical protein
MPIALGADAEVQRGRRRVLGVAVADGRRVEIGWGRAVGVEGRWREGLESA